MKLALIEISDRGELYLPRSRESQVRNLFSWNAFDGIQRIFVDDREHQLGLAGAVQQAWDALDEDVDYVLHLEEDFVFVAVVDLLPIVRTLEANPYLAQVVLKRQPWSNEEIAAGGIMEMHPHLYTDRDGFVEHQRIFSLNPCVYPKRITEGRWPAGNEAEFTQQMVAQGYSFAFWGKRDDPPLVEHIGHQRGSGWRL